MFLENIGVTIPPSIAYGGVVDLPAVLLVLALGVLVTIGIKESLRVNLVLVGIKLFIVLFVVVAGIGFISAENYHPFVPPAQATEAVTGLTQPLLQALLGLEPTAFGVGGIFAGAALVFFAYIGFDVVATTAEETRNPQRDLPIGIIGSLLICTVLYCAVAIVVTGMVPYDELDPKAALASAFEAHGEKWMATLISAGAVAGLTTVVLTLMIGASRVVFAMSRDHLLPPGSPRSTRVPHSVGHHDRRHAGHARRRGVHARRGARVDGEHRKLSAFVLVSVGVIVLRRTRPDLPRSFRVPWVPVLPLAAAAICLYLMLNLEVETWLRFLVWLAIGFVVYFAYSRHHSRLERNPDGDPDVPQVSEGR